MAREWAMAAATQFTVAAVAATAVVRVIVEGVVVPAVAAAAYGKSIWLQLQK